MRLQAKKKTSKKHKRKWRGRWGRDGTGHGGSEKGKGGNLGQHFTGGGWWRRNYVRKRRKKMEAESTAKNGRKRVKRGFRVQI